MSAFDCQLSWINKQQRLILATRAACLDKLVTFDMAPHKNIFIYLAESSGKKCVDIHFSLLHHSSKLPQFGHIAIFIQNAGVVPV